MSSTRGKSIRSQHNYDKQNIPSNSNVHDNNFKPNQKQPLKTGVQIKNKLKSKNLFNQNVSGKKQSQTRKNTHIMSQNVHRKIFNSKNANTNKCQPIRDESNHSSSSSVRSLKSVTFSLDGSVDGERSLSISSGIGLKKRSILKNRISEERDVSNCEKLSRSSSYCSHLKSADQAVDSPSSNSIILHKYERLLKELKATSQKYTDTIYPPCEESLFLKSAYTKDFLQKLATQGYRIKWVRLTQLFPTKSTCLWHPTTKSTITKGFIHSSSNKENNYMPTILNTINKSYLMEKYFQNQQLSQEGIYFVKMHQTQTNTWRYVIVDDFVPVVVSVRKHDLGRVVKPAFLDVQEGDGGVVEIWPFLMQKAFAKYYSTYDSLIKGNSLDFLEEITGDYFTTLSMNLFQSEEDTQTETQTKAKINEMLKNPYNIILAQTMDGLIYPIRSVTSTNQIQLLDIESNYRLETITKTNFESYFAKLHIIQAKRYSHMINCPIKQEHLLEKEKLLQENRKPFILRSFCLKENTQCILALTQKEQRFHRSSKTSKIKQNYAYSWMRMILVVKDSTGYRWVKGAYERRKTLKIETDLEPGEYFVIILPEWTIKPYDLKLSLFSNSETVIERKPYQNHPRIIEQSCMDLAQRFGKLTQINPNICSYNYIDYKVGFIIENINNEKASGQVKILRTIDGLDAYNITPVNSEFQQTKKLEIKIPSLESFTVVLKVAGGVDKSFLEQFDFGI